MFVYHADNKKNKNWAENVSEWQVSFLKKKVFCVKELSSYDPCIGSISSLWQSDVLQTPSCFIREKKMKIVAVQVSYRNFHKKPSNEMSTEMNPVWIYQSLSACKDSAGINLLELTVRHNVSITKNPT